MKKILSLLVCAVIAFSSFTLAASAQNDNAVSFGSEFNFFYYNGKPYIEVDPDILVCKEECYQESVDLNYEQLNQIADLELWVYESETFIDVNYIFYNDAVLSKTYIEKSYYKTYDNVVENGDAFLKINFDVPYESNFVTASRYELLNNETEIIISSGTDEIVGFYDDASFDVYDWYTVEAEIVPEVASIETGILITDEEEYYYLDYDNSNLGYGIVIDDLDGEMVTAFKITDPELIEKLDNAYDKYYGDIGLFSDTDFGEIIANVFLFLICITVPFAVFIVFLVLGLRSKTKYKPMFLTVSIISAAELIIAAIIGLLFLL